MRIAPGTATNPVPLSAVRLRCLKWLGGFCIPLAMGMGIGHAAPYATLDGNGATLPRQWLEFEDLRGQKSPQPVHNSAFLPPANAAMPTNTFNGTLVLNGADLRNNAKHRVLYGTGGMDIPARHYLPEFAFQFVQDGTHLIPVKRAYQPEPAGGHPKWEYIVGPGRVWDEQGDHGFSRAAFTFALTEKGENCVHNGMMSFLFKDNGNISRVWYQITQETCAYYKMDLWGLARAEYQHGGVDNAGSVIAAYRDEVADQLEMRPIAQLEADAGGSALPAASPAAPDQEAPNPYNDPAEHDPEHLTTYGVLYENRLYAGMARTRTGPYPYPQWMVMPLYSWSKAEFVGTAIALLSRLNPHGVSALPSSGGHGEGGGHSGHHNRVAIENLMVADWIPQAQENGSWSNVTLGNLLDMASGHFHNPTVHQADEAELDLPGGFFPSLTNEGKLYFSANHFADQGNAGQIFVYHTSDFYLAGRMLELVSRKLYGKGILQLMDEHVYRGLKLSELARKPKVTYDDEQQPFSGYGAFAYPDDIAKLGRFLAVDKGAINGTQVLDPGKLNSYLQLDLADQGIVAAVLSPNHRFNNGFWSKPLVTEGGCRSRIVYESGYGGLTKVLGTRNPVLHNPGWVYFYVSDYGEFAYTSAVNKLATLIGCPDVGDH